jgi:hypothetical protein
MYKKQFLADAILDCEKRDAHHEVSFVTGIDEAMRNLFRHWCAGGTEFAASSKRPRGLVELITERPLTQELLHPPTYQSWFSLKLMPLTIPLIPLLALLTLSQARAADNGASLAFSRFLSRSAPGMPQSTDIGPIAVEIDASLPQMSKQARFEAIRHRGPTGAPEYELVSSNGDSAVKHQVIARYLAAEQHANARPASSFAVTRENYKFRYMYLIEGGGNRFYVFAIKPRRRSEGLMEGQIWIDAATGGVVHQEGHLAKRASVFIRRVGIVRDTGPRVDLPYVSVIRIDIETRVFGRATLTIRERPAISISNADHWQ